MSTTILTLFKLSDITNHKFPERAITLSAATGGSLQLRVWASDEECSIYDVGNNVLVHVPLSGSDVTVTYKNRVVYWVPGTDGDKYFYMAEVSDES